MIRAELKHTMSKSEYQSIVVNVSTISDEIRFMFSEYQNEGAVTQFEYMFTSPYGDKHMKQNKGVDYNEILARVKKKSRFCRKAVFKLDDFINRVINIKKMLTKQGLLGIKKFHPIHKYEKIIYFSKQLCAVSYGISVTETKYNY